MQPNTKFNRYIKKWYTEMKGYGNIDSNTNKQELETYINDLSKHEDLANYNLRVLAMLLIALKDYENYADQLNVHSRLGRNFTVTALLDIIEELKKDRNALKSINIRISRKDPNDKIRKVYSVTVVEPRLRKYLLGALISRRMADSLSVYKRDLQFDLRSPKGKQFPFIKKRKNYTIKIVTRALGLMLLKEFFKYSDVSPSKGEQKQISIQKRKLIVVVLMAAGHYSKPDSEVNSRKSRNQKSNKEKEKNIQNDRKYDLLQKFTDVNKLLVFKSPLSEEQLKLVFNFSA